MNVTQLTEAARAKQQIQLDAAKTQIERNKLGQFATPIELAMPNLPTDPCTPETY